MLFGMGRLSFNPQKNTVCCKYAVKSKSKKEAFGKPDDLVKLIVL